ncbi:MAG: Spy/CpxP family protein refolding chaperone [bacterium]|nr:Spy/CpxP family protein refolding chaperone [bacterium]
MKKILFVICLLFATSSVSFAATQAPAKPENVPPVKQQNFKKPAQRPSLDKVLNLTEEQKVKAKEIRMQGHKEMKPLIDELRSKQEQKRMLMQNKNAGVKEVQKLEKINKEIVNLKKQIREIRIKNNKQFEEILTEEQKVKFNELKKEGRKNFAKHHKHPYPVQKGCNKAQKSFPVQAK